LLFAVDAVAVLAAAVPSWSYPWPAAVCYAPDYCHASLPVLRQSNHLRWLFAGAPVLADMVAVGPRPAAAPHTAAGLLLLLSAMLCHQWQCTACNRHPSQAAAAVCWHGPWLLPSGGRCTAGPRWCCSAGQAAASSIFASSGVSPSFAASIHCRRTA